MLRNSLFARWNTNIFVDVERLREDFVAPVRKEATILIPSEWAYVFIIKEIWERV